MHHTINRKEPPREFTQDDSDPPPIPSEQRQDLGGKDFGAEIDWLMSFK